jgi:uncharacterized protein (DUF111 family)
MLLLANVDDISGEGIPHVINGLMEQGAESVHVVQAITKKGRFEYLLFVDAPSDRVEPLADYLACELGTLGVRAFDPKHIRFEYKFSQVRLTVSTHGEPIELLIQVKQVLGRDGQVISVKAEHEDLQAACVRLREIGEGASLAALKRLVEQAAQSKSSCSLGHLQATHAR